MRTDPSAGISSDNIFIASYADSIFLHARTMAMDTSLFSQLKSNEEEREELSQLNSSIVWMLERSSKRSRSLLNE